MNNLSFTLSCHSGIRNYHQNTSQLVVAKSIGNCSTLLMLNSTKDSSDFEKSLCEQIVCIDTGME